MPDQVSTVCELRTSRGSSWIKKRQRNQRPNGQYLLDHRESKKFQKNIYFHFTDYTKAFVGHNKLWKILKEVGIPDYLTFFQRNLYAYQEATVRTCHETTDWFQIRKGIKGYLLSLCLFNLCEDYIMWNVGLDEAQAGIRLPGERSITSYMQMTPPFWQKVKN